MRLSESSKTLRISSGALASTFWFAACAVSIRSSSSSGGGGGSKRARTPKGRRMRLTPSEEHPGERTEDEESRLASHDRRRAAASGAVLARARAVTSSTAASSATSSTPPSGAASATQERTEARDVELHHRRGSQGPHPGGHEAAEHHPHPDGRGGRLPVGPQSGARGVRPGRDWLASSRAFSSETPDSADSTAAIIARRTSKPTQPSHRAQNGIAPPALAWPPELCWLVLLTPR